MKKNILIIFTILAFSLAVFGNPPARRPGEPGISYRFITKQLGLLGLNVGKIMRRGDVYEISIKSFSPKTNALRLNKQFKSFTLKVRLKRLKTLRRGDVTDNKTGKRGIIDDGRTSKGIIIINTKNTKLVLIKNELLGANFVIGDSGMPKGIIVQK
ncbi:MAG: hypothetical protein ABFR36_07455 [Acidobacteriota bacterium]